MLEVLFQGIPRFLFEPIAIAALIGWSAGLFYILLHDRSKLAFYYTVSTALLFAIGWRCVIHIWSSRYAAILLYPGLLLCSWTCFRSPFLFGEMLGISNWSYRKYLPAVLLGGVLLAEVGKTFHYNQYYDYIIYNCIKVQNDSRQYPDSMLISTKKYVNRLSYYTGLPAVSLNTADFSEEENMNSILDEILLYRYQKKNFYVMLMEDASIPLLSAVQLKLEKNEWVPLSWQYSDRKRKKRLSVYRFSPKTEGLRKIEGQELIKYCNEAKFTRIANGGFESSFNMEVQNMQIQRLIKMGVVFFKDPSRRHPSSWFLNWKPSFPEKVEFEISKVAPIAGNYSLRMYGQNFRLDNTTSFPAETYRIRGLVRGVKGSEFALGFYRISESQKLIGVGRIANFILPSDDIFLFDVIVDKKHILPGKTFKLALFLNSGEIYIDELTVDIL